MTLRFDVITILPEMFNAITSQGITSRALQQELWQLECWNPRRWAQNAYGSVDDRPYGGGPGMVMQAAPLEAAIDAALAARGGTGKVIHLSPQGKVLNHALVTELAAGEGAVLLCGRYEGIDERLIAQKADEEISLGDFVLSGGEIAALALIDACVRQLPGALGNIRSAHEESFAEGLLDYPHYTHPREYQSAKVPAVLLSGNHEQIRRWRFKQSIERTRLRRPQLFAAWLKQHGMSVEVKNLLGALDNDAVTFPGHNLAT